MIPGPITYRFGEFELDQAAYELRRAGVRIPLARQPMDLLLLLLEHRHTLVLRDDIARRLWAPDVFIDFEAGIRTAILKVRQALADHGDAPTLVETVPGKGYRFIGSVELSQPQQPAPSTREADAATRRPAEPRRHNLPAEVTSFIGRESELLTLTRELGSSPLLTLTGAGGVGKTRLGTRLASSRAHDFRDGVWLVDLAALATPDLVAPTIAATLGIREGPQRSAQEALLENLRDRDCLLVLDNCEHLIDVCAELAQALIRAAPRLRILATSREALRVPGETVWIVPTLSFPKMPAPVSDTALFDFEASRLFIERARHVVPSFTPTVDNADAIASICRRLDGIPLAIELAAARVAVLVPAQIEARLQDRFRLLTGGARTAVARQRTLEATVDWSHQLLSNLERVLLSRLSVFPSEWTLEAAEQVCGQEGIGEGDVLDLLSSLVQKSLVIVDTEASGGPRYRFLETVRQYARDRLVQTGTAERLRVRHFEFFFNEFRGVLPILRHRDQLPCIRRLRIEQDNVRAALEWALASPALAEKGLELAGALFWFWTKRGLFEEGRLWLEQALTAAVHAPASSRARALIGLAHMHHFQGRSYEAVVADALALGVQDGDAWVVSFALFMQGLDALESGNHEHAAARAMEARAAADRSGELVQHGGPLLILASLAVLGGDHDRAQQLYEESIDVHRRDGDPWGLSIVLLAAAGLSVVQEDFTRGYAQASEAMALCQEFEDPRGIAWSLDVFAGLSAAGGEADRAARLWGASDKMLESVSSSLSPEIRWIRDRHLEPARVSLGQGAFDIARAEGRAMPPGRAVALARERALVT